jgi:hydrogenase maturation factor
VLAALADAGIAAAEVGEVVTGGGAVRLAEPDGASRTLTEPQADPYWPAYRRAIDEGWQ